MENREIDALIAEKIFRWEWVVVTEERKVLVPSLDDERRLWTGLWEANGIPHYLPHYTTNMQDTWLLVEKLKQEDQYYFELENGDFYDYECHFSNFSAEGDTAPMAICLAALKVAGVEIGLY